MSYKSLKNFSKILNRQDFEIISDEANIKSIILIIKNKTSDPDGNEIEYINNINIYNKNLISFYKWLSPITKGNKDLDQGFNLCYEVLSRASKLLQENELKRKSISNNYLRKFNKQFLKGLNRILQGIRISFDPLLLGNTRMQERQIVNFILDENEGFGRYYGFNSKGAFAFYKRIETFDRPDLILINSKLSRGPDRKIRGWLDYGERNEKIRILAKKGFLGKVQIFFLYHNQGSEKKSYEAQLMSSTS